MIGVQRLCLLAILAISCNVLSSRAVQQVEGQKTFAELSLAEKYTYLSAVLKAQREEIKSVRIERVRSLAEEITHKGYLTVQLMDDGFQHSKRIRVSWSKVQADSIELLRCKLKNLETGATVSDRKIVKNQEYDFDKLQSEPNSYGFLDCQRVYGRIQNGVSLIDYGAENKFKYVYFFRPCFKNHSIVVPATTATETEQCGEDKFTAAESNSEALATTDNHTLVFRYCTKERQACSSVLRHNLNPFVFNQGVEELPLYLFDELRKVRAEIKTHEDAIYKEGHAALAELNAIDKGVAMMDAAGEGLKKLQDDHNAANERRKDKAKSITDITGIIHQNMAKSNRLGYEMSFRSRNCYGEYRDMQEEVELANEQLSKLNESPSQDIQATLDPQEKEQEEFEKIELESWVKAMSIGECVVSNALSARKLINIDGLVPFDGKKFEISKNISDHKEALSKSKEGATFGQAEWSLAAANFAVDMIPLETSELNRGGGVAAFAGALNSIFMKEDTYTRNHCQACLDHMAQVRHHYRALYLLNKDLDRLSKQIEQELTSKGVVDPDAK